MVQSAQEMKGVSMFYFRYFPADWVKQYGLPQHHLRVISAHVDANAQRWYWIFDTTLARGYADFCWMSADQLEAGSELVERAQNELHAWEIIKRCESLRYTPYSIPQRQDCESLQGFAQYGCEQQRQSRQVAWAGLIGTVAVAWGVIALAQHADSQA